MPSGTLHNIICIVQITGLKEETVYSKSFWVSLLFQMPLFSFWAYKGWWDVVFNAIPLVVSVSFATVAVFFGLLSFKYNEDFLEADEEHGKRLEGTSLFAVFLATISLFLIIQISSFMYALLIKAMSSYGNDFRVFLEIHNIPYKYQILKLAHFSKMTAWFFGSWLFTFSLFKGIDCISLLGRLGKTLEISFAYNRQKENSKPGAKKA